MRESLALVVEEFAARTQTVFDGMRSLNRETYAKERKLQELSRQISEMKATQINGKIEASAAGAKSDFAVLFDEAWHHIQGGRQDCADLLEALNESRERIEEFAEIESGLLASLNQLHEAHQSIASLGREVNREPALV